MSGTNLAIVGTDLKFIRPLLARFEREEGIRVRVDEWPKFRVHDPSITKEVLTWADVIVCEWAGPNAVIASQAKRADQRMIVRLHRMELAHPEWRNIEIDAVDLVVTVGPHYRRRVVEVTGWPEAKVVVIPNFVDETVFALPKQDGSRFHLGMIGYASERKRVDLALDVLTELQQSDPRYRLFLKGSLPWGLKWVEDRPEEAGYFNRIRQRLDENQELGQAVTFDPPGDDVATWLRKIGFVLSTSDDESFHLSPAEGMASRAVPVIRPWPGADEIYDPEWIVDGARMMAATILAIAADEKVWRETGARAQREVLSKYRLDDIARMWLARIMAARSPAR